MREKDRKGDFEVRKAASLSVIVYGYTEEKHGGGIEEEEVRHTGLGHEERSGPMHSESSSRPAVPAQLA